MLFDNFTSASLIQSANACSPMFDTLSGIITLVRPADLLKAQLSIAVTQLGIM